MVMVHWVLAPVALEQAEPSCQAQHRFCFTEPFDVGEGDKCESSPVLPSSLGRRCHHLALLHQDRDMCWAPKTLFILLALRGSQPAQAARLTLTPSDAHSSVARPPLRRSTCRQRFLGSWPCHQNVPQGCPVSCHLPATRLLPAAAGPHPRGSFHPSELVLVSLSKPWLVSAGAQPAQGCQAHVPAGGAASPTTLRVLL